MEVHEFQQWLHSRLFPPAVIVIGTVRAVDIVRNNIGLSLSELFAPFCGQERPVPVSYMCLDRSTAIPNPIFRFVDVKDCEPIPIEKLQVDLDEILQREAPHLPQNNCATSSYPWFDAWFEKVSSSLRWTEGECLDQPFAVIMMATSLDGDAISIFEQLSHESHMPSLCRRGFLDSNVARVRILLHDHSEPEAPMQSYVDEQFQLMQSTFSPASCYFLNLDRSDAGPSGTAPSPLERYQPSIGAIRSRNGCDVGHICGRLTSRNVEELEGLAADVIAQGAFPWMENRLKELDAHITTNRKGIGNRFKRMWRISDANASSQQGYNLSSLEGQIRAAGDLAFHMRDYVLALSYYRTATTDFKALNLWKSVAGCYEMSGICSFLAGQPRTDWFRFMEHAYEFYHKVREARWATRCTVVCARMDRSRGREVALRCMRLSNDFPDSAPRSALFLEQASKHYFDGNSQRKAMFHLVLAGHTFNKCALKQYALRCYNTVLPFHTDGNWIHIKDHLHFTMGRQAFSLGMLHLSMKHFVSLLNSFACPRRAFVTTNIDREATYIRECLYVINTVKEKQGPKGIKPSIELPALDARPRVVFPDDSFTSDGDTVCQASNVAGVGPAFIRDGSIETWEILGKRCAPAGLQHSDHRALRLREICSQAPTTFPTCASSSNVEQIRDVGIGKCVVVELSLRNPFQNPIEIADACLCASVNGKPLPIGDVIIIDKISIAGRQTVSVRFQLVASVEGVLRIDRVQWMFFAQVPCSLPLTFPPLGQLEIHVHRNIPSFHARIDGLPVDKVLWAGETRWCFLYLENDGDVTIEGFNVCWYPSDFVVMSAGNVSEEASVCKFSSTKTLEPGEEVRFDVLVRPSVSGTQPVKRVLRFCICGAIDNSHVWSTTEIVFDVKPSLVLKACRYPSSIHPDREFVSCMVENVGVTKSTYQLKNLWYDAVSAQKVQISIGSDQVIPPGSRIQLLQHLPELATSSSCRIPCRVPELVHLQEVFAGDNHRSPAGSDSRQTTDLVVVNQKGSIIVDWKCEDEGRKGFVHIPAVPFSDFVSCQQSMSFPLRLQIVCKAHHVWLPGSDNPCQPWSFEVRADNTAAMHGGNLMERDAPTMSSGFLWIGCTQIRVKDLVPGQRTRVHFHAYFPSPGVFNLNRVRFFLFPAEGRTEPQGANAFTFPMESLIYVLESLTETKKCPMPQ